MAAILLSIHHTQGCENTSETNQKEHGKVEAPMMDTLSTHNLILNLLGFSRSWKLRFQKINPKCFLLKRSRSRHIVLQFFQLIQMIGSLMKIFPEWVTDAFDEQILDISSRFCWRKKPLKCTISPINCIEKWVPLSLPSNWSITTRSSHPLDSLKKCKCNCHDVH